MKKPFTWERGPFEDCWKCREKGTFGILSVGRDCVTKRCTRCRYSHSEALPQLNKKVIYLDQFAFSELHKLRGGTRREDEWTPFWTEVEGLLNQTMLLQQVIMPHSDIHHTETIVSPFANELRDTQEAIGGDISFVNTDEIQLAQIEKFAQAYFSDEEPQIAFDVDEIVEGERNAWLPDMRITAGMDWSSFAPETRRGREGSHAAIISLVESWQKSGDGFDEVLERELGAYLQSRREALLHAVGLFEKGLAENDIWALANMAHSFVNRELELVRHHARKAGIPEDRLFRATSEFWNWPKNREQPFGRILAYMFASLAGQFKAGRKKLPSAGFMNDVSAIAAYAPYVDAMFVDKECAELLRHGRCQKDLAYKAEIYSLNNASAFTAYLTNIVHGMPDDVRREASLLYGLD